MPRNLVACQKPIYFLNILTNVQNEYLLNLHFIIYISFILQFIYK